MATGVTFGADATWENIGHLPAGWQHATYSTQIGNAGIAAPESWLDANPLVLRYTQLPSGNDPKASVIDVEANAATVEDVPGWLNEARANWRAAATPGQRWPAVYVNGANIHQVANICVAAHTTMPVPLVLANWSIGQAQAITDVLSESGPFPLVGVQFADTGDGGLFDLDIYSSAWLANVARKAVAQPPAIITDGILVSHAMGWTGHRMKSEDHGVMWTAVNK